MIMLHYFEQQESRVVGIYINREDPSQFIVGRVVEVNDGFLLMRTISLDGEYDGWLLCKTELIYMIESDSVYVREHIPVPKNDSEPECPQSIDEFLHMMVQRQKKVRLGGSTRKMIASGTVLGTDGKYLVVRGAGTGKSRRIRMERIFYYDIEEDR